jgi:hypothetical protein
MRTSARAGRVVDRPSLDANRMRLVRCSTEDIVQYVSNTVLCQSN